MTPAPGIHLSADDFDAWLTGALASEPAQHLAGCPECQQRSVAEREIVGLLSTLSPIAPSPQFADRVMARLTVRAPASSPRDLVRRAFATRRSAAIAAGLLIALIGSMSASVVWTLGHQATLAAMGSWLASQAGAAAWLGLRGLGSNFIEQPWFASAREMAASPGRLALVVGLALAAYVGGLLALRRLLALPAPQVAHAGI